jgi:predicted DNA-binding transcriptional regulator AlpA
VDEAIADRLLTPAEVAGRLGIPISTLANWRSARMGPDYLRVGRHARYRPVDIETWIEQRAVRCAADVTGRR